MKICNKSIHIIDQLRFPTMLMKISELYHIIKDKIVSDSFKTLYQCKVGLFLFAAIATRPNIAFAIFRFSRFNQWPGPQYYKAINQVFHYLFLI